MIYKIVCLFMILLFSFTSTFAAEKKTISSDNNTQINLTKKELEFIKEKKDIYIANELDWIPFDFNENNKAKGYVIDYIKLVSKKLGLKPIFVTKKWSALVKDFKNKEIDILPVLSYNKKREKYLDFTNSFYSQELSIVIHNSRNDILNIDDLKNKKIAMMKNWNITNVIKHEYPKLNVIEFDSLKDIFDAIQNNFVDATIQNDILSNYYINQDYYGILKTTEKIIVKSFDTKLFMGVRKDLLILSDLINKAIISISKEELRILEKKWIKTSSNTILTFEEKNFIKTTKINVITGGEWSPFSFIENEKLHGISIDLWEYVVKKAKLNMTIKVNYDFIEMLKSIETKENDIILATSRTKEKEKIAIFTNTYLNSPIGIVTLSDNDYIKSAKELLGKKIAVGKGYSAHKLLEQEYPNMEFVFVSSSKKGLEYVSQNKAYAYVDIMPALTYGIEKHSFTNLKVSGQTGLDFELSSMIRLDYPLLKSIIDKTMKNMTFQEKDKIFNKWLKAKFEKEFDYSLLWKVIFVFTIILIYVLYKNSQLKNYQKQLEKANKETQNSLDNFKILMNLNIAGILIIKNKKIVYVNDEIVRMLEFKDASQLINKDISIFFSDKEIHKVNSLVENSNESYDSKAKKLNEEEIPVLLRNNSIIFENKDSILLSVVDLSDIKNKEEIMIQQSKLASLGEMIGNIAHQWRQPLSYISTAASGMKIKKEYNQLEDKEFFKLTDVIVDTSMFLSKTIEDFSHYIKGEKIQKEFNIKHCIEKIVSIMNGTFVNNFIKIDMNMQNITINGYENELSQALLNILANSNDTLKEMNQNNRNIFINTFIKNDKVFIEIIDTGAGIDEEIIKKVFDPYFSTKHKSQGTGLGLYMTYNIIKRNMKGDITIENTSYKNINKCTKVTIIL